MATTRICPPCTKEYEINESRKSRSVYCPECSRSGAVNTDVKSEMVFQPFELHTWNRLRKIAKICTLVKPIDQFNFANKRTGIRSSYCKICQGKIGNAHRAGQDRAHRKCLKLKTTVAWYYSQLEKQNHLCAICLQPETHPCQKGGKPRSLAMDHSHETGKVRGLLCFRCNTSIHLLDKFGPSWAERALQYLKETY